MGKCLVTHLNNGSVKDNSLLRAGEMRIVYNKVSSPTDKTQGISIQSCKETKLEIIGDGYFTDKTLQQNLGKTMLIPATDENFTGQSTPVYSSNGDYEIAILDKYSIVVLLVYAVGSNGTFADMSNKAICIDDFKYSTHARILELYTSKTHGNISALGDLTNLTYFNAPNSKIYGDISSIRNLTKLQTFGVASTQVSGDISAISNLTALTNFNIASTQVSGDISAISNLTALTNFNITSTQVSGDISAISNLTALTRFEGTKMSGDISNLKKIVKLSTASCKSSRLTGDLATLPATCYFASFSQDNGSEFTWGTRPSSANIVAIEGGSKLLNVDKMLQDQAQCVAAIPSSGYSYYKEISVVGNRTSASDAAVATLQQKGYTVTIIPA